LRGKALLAGTASVGLIAALASAEAGYRIAERPFLRRREPWRAGRATNARSTAPGVTEQAARDGE
jgi:peptidoglycan/LPS O-acetylase OafA/YrhL